MSPWKWMFLIIAAISVFWSLVLAFALPTSQATAKWLTQEEKVAAVEMVRDNNTGIHSRKFVPYQVKEALLDPKTYLFFWFAFFGNLANSVAIVSPLLQLFDCFLLTVDLVRYIDYFKLRIHLSPNYACE
jgi:ACS family allantoate permease-like MFS transporter